MTVHGDYTCRGMDDLEPQESLTSWPDDTDHLCLDWKELTEDYCQTFRFSDLPEGINTDHEFEFCYHHQSELTGWQLLGSDHFKFDGDNRNLPRHRDYSASDAVVGETCKAMCSERHHGMSVYGVGNNAWKNIIDGFHVSQIFPPLVPWELPY